MPTIQNHIVKQTSIVLVPNSPIRVVDVNVNQIRSVLIETLGDTTVDPMLTQAAGIAQVFDATSQMGVTIIEQENKVIITDGSPTPYTGRPLERLVRFASRVRDIIFVAGGQVQVRAFGFNVASTFDLGFPEGANNLSSSYLRDRLLNAPGDVATALGGDIESVSSQIVYRANEIRYQLSFAPRYTGALEETNSVNAGINAHHAVALPEFSVLQRFCQESYDKFSSDLRVISD